MNEREVVTQILIPFLIALVVSFFATLFFIAVVRRKE